MHQQVSGLRLLRSSCRVTALIILQEVSLRGWAFENQENKRAIESSSSHCINILKLLRIKVRGDTLYDAMFKSEITYVESVRALKKLFTS